MPRPETLKRAQAAKIFKQTNSVSETARQVGVARTTVQRWQKDPSWLEAADQAQEYEDKGLNILVPKAMRVLDEALDGKAIKQAQIRAALEVVKASNALKDTGPRTQGLAELIAQLDEEGGLDSD